MRAASILLCTIDRFDLTAQCVGGALANTEYPFELLCTDNGSQDRRVIDLVASWNPAYHRLNTENVGFPVAMNQMMLRADGDYIVLIDNDTAMPRGWLRHLVETYEAIPKSGIAALYSLMERHPVQTINNRKVRVGEWVFGERLFHRSLMEKVGCICEDYGVYGLDDADFSHRVRLAGLLQYYLAEPELEAIHMGWDIGEQSQYRRMKDECLGAHGEKYKANIRKYVETGNYFIPFPELQ
jgi:O-antigen biosynthesis protein